MLTTILITVVAFVIFGLLMRLVEACVWLLLVLLRFALRPLLPVWWFFFGWPLWLVLSANMRIYYFLHGRARSALGGVPLNTRVDRATGQVLPIAQTEAAGSGASRHTPVSLHLTCNRLRRRSRWVAGLEAVVGVRRGQLSALARGRWTPDLPSANYDSSLNLILSMFEDGAVLLGGGVVQCEDGSFVPYKHIELSDGSRELVFPELLSKLSGYALLRQRDAVLVSALRLRALDWCKKRELPKDLVFMVVTSAMRLALEVPPAESVLAQSLADLGPDSPRWWHRA